jgi:hypothetical protein
MGVANITNNILSDSGTSISGLVPTSLTISTTSPLTGGGELTANKTIAIPAATTSVNGYLTSTDWTTFNSKQNAFTNPVTGTGTTNYIPKFTGASTIGNSLIFDNGTNVGIGTITPIGALEVVSSSAYVISSKMNVTIGAFMNRFTNGNTEGIFLGHTGSDNGSITGAVANTVWIGADYISTASYRPLALATGGIARINITSGGNVLIGTATDAGYKLDVNGTGRYNGGSSNDVLKIQSTTTASDIWIYDTNTTAGNVRVRSTSNALVLISGGFSSLTLSSAGAATFYSSVTATSFFESSDKTIKTLIKDNYQTKGIESVVAKLYTKNGKEELGYFAQDVQGILSSAVNIGTDGLLSLSYREVHTAKIARLEKEVEELKARLN